MFDRRICLSLSVMGAAALLLGAGCFTKPPPPAPTAAPQTTAMPAAHLVGNEACRECHQSEFDAHHDSNHSRTLRVASARLLGPLTPPAEPIPETKYAVKHNGEEMSFAREDAAGTSAKIDYAFGSGKLGMTYVALQGKSTILEMRMSRFPSRHAWYLTPGQELVANEELGVTHDPAASRRCFLCHSMGLEGDSAKPDDRLLGVGCESCHGPGSAHIQAAKTPGTRDFLMPSLSKLSARQLNEMCGRCHRTLESVNLGGTESAMTQRFQPYGLMQSPCFVKSNEALSCLTCHDPHKNASTVDKDYEAACLKCHSAPASAVPSATPTASTPKVCPVNPKTKCIGCHMPPRKLFPFSKLPVYMADHLIWAYGKKQANPPAPSKSK